MSQLFSDMTLGPLKLSNRLVIAPMCQYSADHGRATDWHQMHIGNLAMSGAATVILEATAVSPEGRITPGCLGLWDDQTQQALVRPLQFARQHSDAKLLIQLAHAGRKASCAVPWESGRQLDPEQGGWQTVSASNLPFADTDRAPETLDGASIKQVCEEFKASTRRASQLGLDGVEIHAAHGYLLHQFLSPLSNKRTDEYGGSLENRMRLVLEVFKEVRSEAPPHMTVGVRISACDWVDGGWSLDESVSLCERLQQLGCDFIDVSSGGLSASQKIPLGPGYQLSLAHTIRQKTGVTTMAVGLITDPFQAEQALVSGQADMIAIARAALYEPRWGWHAAARLGAKLKAPPQYWRGAPAGHSDLFLK
ncbi:NADH:flavin oxidoreductase/NADH oxidase [Orrella marina]|uniref:Oxidoreductase n=1 Tax=Orrella marina TaxID=2163011 RepID=A0A2R4XJ46_9BURK|nr:NADH:flavin oxidoreductase/NADH oxidase [Orrella marina]AWB33821.1 oxidoreductase [Orrella marina]